MTIAQDRKKDFILVTDDVKEDWWHYEGSRLVSPLPALRKEFREVTGQSIWQYSTEGFLRAAKEFSKIDVGDAALKEVTAALDVQRNQRLQPFRKFGVIKIDQPAPPNKLIYRLKETRKKGPPPETSSMEDDET